jgi:Uma2 family endonuclease
VQAKVADWLEAGCLLVWVIDPERETVTVYRANGTVSVFGANDTLTGDDVLPGFACEVRALVGGN